jgi:glycosyltransferase involved in cell wall biosynthesis
MSVSHVYTDVSAFSRATPEPDIAALRPDGGVLILTMGRFVPQKNLPMLVRAFVRARNDGMNARLVLIGSGPLERKLKALASEAPDGSIVFKEWTDNPAGAMRAADIFALSSNYEGWGRVCIEALAAGTTLLMTDTGCAGEVVEDGENGLVVPVGDEWSFMHGLTLLAGDTDLRARLSSGGKETVQTLPTFDENVALYIASIRACLKRANNNGTRSPKS